jgi:tetratricopeptide (TPR) repeat protein
MATLTLPAVAATPAPEPDPTPLLTYAAAQHFSAAAGMEGQVEYRNKLERINFSLKRDPPPETNCAQTLGAKRFATLFDDLGDAYSNLGDNSKAAAAYSHAIECNPRAGFLHAQRAAALLDLGRYHEARAETERELALGRGTFALHNLITQLDFIDHRWADAAAHAQLAVVEAPDDEQATYWQCFLWLSQIHNGVTLPALADRRTASTWPAPILLSLQGVVSEAELVEDVSAERGTTRRRELLTEALYYTGQRRLAEKRPDLALRYFEATVRLQVTYFIEHHLAVAELENLRGRS